MQSYYYGGDSLLHRLNPLTKIVATAPFLLLVALVTDPWTPAAFIVLFALNSVVLGRIPFSRYARTVAPLLVLVTGFVLTYPLVVDSARVAGTAVAYQLGPLVVRWGAIVFGLAAALRILALMMGTLLFVLTTDSKDFIRALVQQWRLSYKIGYSAMAAYRFVPMLSFELGVIRNAHKVRGISDRGGLRAQYDRAARYALPLLATAIRKAERTALAMDSRGFGAFETRTFYRRLRFAPRDWGFIAGFWLLSTTIILILQRTGLLGPLVLLQQF